MVEPEAAAASETQAPEPAAARALAIRRGGFRALCGLSLSALFGLVLAPLLDVSGVGVSIMTGLGGWLGLALFPQALLEHLLAPGQRTWGAWAGRLAAVWSVAALTVVVALAQGVALDSQLAGDREQALARALDFVSDWVLGRPGQSVPIVFALGGALAWSSTLTLAGVRSASVRGSVLANLVGAPLLYLCLYSKNAAVFMGVLLATSIALPLLRLAGDRLEARWTHWRSEPA